MSDPRDAIREALALGCSHPRWGASDWYEARFGQALAALDEAREQANLLADALAVFARGHPKAGVENRRAHDALTAYRERTRRESQP